MTTSTRYDLVRISESRLGLIGRPWITTTTPTPPARAARWGSIVGTLVCIVTIAALAVAGGK